MSVKASRERGGVFVELVLALPIIITIPFAVLELSRLLEKVQVVNLVGQEMASAAYRDCADFDDKKLSSTRLSYVRNQADRVIARTNTCLATVQNAFVGADRMTGLVRGTFNISMSVYRYYSATDAQADGGERKLYRIGISGNPVVACPGLGTSGTGECSSNAVFDTRTSKQVISAASAQARERFVIVEINFIHSAVAPFVKILREIGGSDHAYREVTIL